MIPAEHQELITAAVDGELSAPELRALRRVLDSSAAARSLYAKLKADRDRVRGLSQVAPPADLRAKILSRIASATPAPHTAKPIRIAQPETNPSTLPVPAFTRHYSGWVPVAVAASLLLSVTAASFAFFNSHSGSQPHAAKQPWSNVLPAPVDAPAAVPSPTAPRETRPDPAVVVRVDVSPVPPLPPPRPVVPEAVAVAPAPRPAYHDLLGSRPLPKIPPLEFAHLRVPFLRTVVELERDDIRQELTDELRRDPSSFRLDLFVRDTARGVDVFQNAARAAGLTVFADAATVEKLTKKQAHSVVIYTECMSAQELTQLFTKICGEDSKFSPRVCDSLHVTPVARADENELKLVLGMDAGLFKRPRTGSPGSIGTGLEKAPLDRYGDPKSVSAGTIDSVTNALTNPPGKAPEKPAVLLTWQVASGATRTAPSQSAELKHFLSKRGDRKPTAVPVIIVIRPGG
ncbi:anti-sigma factor [Frigoriglobus tundricola]|uniref:Zinc-finger domain-containing protein n=1 Tax=Frigoriglobus tundricola TaxID=2774151 RepID=A0A6M5Z5R1_9BACT|nr:hypothetical protein [Frigoriglobus tundricola]QJX00603.1 hypothetical protein FTUN_8235 [Frigoriglobus tundricola]